jgi:Putative 2OG-Fe(II) oxygenase
MIWPEHQRIEPAGDPMIGITHFADAAEYHAKLRETMLRLERSSAQKEKLPRGSCGVKVHHIENWKCEAAQWVHQRAIALFKRMLKTEQAHVDASWGNIYRREDYCIPHSHIRAQAGVVYMVDVGDESAAESLDAKFYIADPRVSYCCQHHPGHMTRMLIPAMKQGSMIIFPGQVMHGVNPYFGARPRLTMSWNLNLEQIAGDPRKTFEKK